MKQHNVVKQAVVLDTGDKAMKQTKMSVCMGYAPFIKQYKN